MNNNKITVTFLGTSATPSTPILFCHCEFCTSARTIGGKNLRKKTSLMINDDLLIDLGPDVPISILGLNLNLNNLKTCLQTHAHADHFDSELLISRHPKYGSVVINNLIFAGSKGTLSVIDCKVAKYGYGSIFDKKLQKILKIKIQEIKPFESYLINGYQIIGYPANHDINNEALIYLIKKNDISIFYGTDTSIFLDSVWHSIIERKKTFDIVILDHTYGIGFDSTDHLATSDFINLIRRLKDENIVTMNSHVYATHISHEGMKEHDEFNKFALENGYELAYDGLIVII